jgi:hypothetical protein
MLEGTPNILAWMALILCLPFSLWAVRRWRPAVSVPIVLIVSHMFLPSAFGFEVPAIPPIDRNIIPQWSALLGCLIFRRKSLAGAKPGRGLDLFIVLRILGYLGSCLTNRDPLIFPRGFVPGLSLYTFMGGTVGIILYWWPAIFLGRTLIRTSKDLKTLFTILVGAAVVYTAFAIVEMIFSPQLNVWVYGYHQTNFIQAVKGNHYRPMVFMMHGLILAFFLSLSIMAAAALGKVGARVFGYKGRAVAIYLLVILVLCHSLGALIYAVLVLPLIWFAPVKTQTRIATVVAFLAFSYPVARAFDLVPVDSINAFVLDKFGEDRWGSLGLRLSEEAYVMNRALQRPVFGWGGGARSFRLDPVTGANTSTTDGLWAIELGQHGAVGFVSIFGMLLYPVWRSRRAVSRLPRAEDRTLVACLALIGAVYMVEMIPNSSVDPYITFMVAVLSRIVTRGLDRDDPPPAIHGQAPSWRSRVAQPAS